MSLTHSVAPPAQQASWNALIGRAGVFICIFLLYSSLLPFLTVTFGIPATPAYIAIVVAAAALSIGLVRAQPTPRSSKFIIAALVAYLGLALAQAVVVPPATSDILKFRILWAGVTIAAIIVLQNATRRDLVGAIRIVVGFSILVILLEYTSRFSLPLKMTTVVGRAAGLYMNPNAAALFLCAALPIVTLHARLAVRLAWYLAVAVATQLTFSRGGIILEIAMVVVAEVFSPSSVKTKNYGLKILLLALVALALYASYAMMIEGIQKFLASALDANTANRLRFGVNDSSRIRLYIIQHAIEVAQSSIIFGKGLGFAYSWSEGISVHNIFVLVLLEQGVLGLTWMAGLFIALLSMRAPFGLWVSTAMVVGGMFNHNLFDSPTYGLIIAIYAALPVVLRERSSA